MLWDKLFINATLATMDQSLCSSSNPLGLLQNAALALKSDKIIWVGLVNDLPNNYQNQTNQVIDVKNKLITPGLIDCHTHIVYGGNRANEFSKRLHGASYEEIAKAGGGIQSTVTATRAVSEQELYDQSLPRVKQLATEGVTSLEIKSGYGLNLESEIKMLKVARRLGQDLGLTIKTSLLAAHCVPLEYKNNSDEYIDLIVNQILPEIVNLGLADAVDGFCENIAFSPEQIERVFIKAKELNLPVKLHSEQLTDQGGAALAAKYQALSAEHLEYISESSVKAMAQSNTVAVLLPGAFYFLRETKKPPIELFRKYKVPMAIATDSNPGSSPCTSLLLMLNMACTFFRMTPEEALLGVTKHAAQALGIEHIVGSLKKDMQADLVIWDIDQPEELCYRFGFNPVNQIIKKGK